MIQTLMAQVKEYKTSSILAPVFTGLEVLLEVLIPFVTAALIDNGIEAGNIRQVYLYGGLMLIMAFLSLLCGVLAGRYAAKASTGLACNLRDGMYAKVQTFAFSNIDKYSTAGLVTRMTTDVTNVQNAYQMILRIAVRAPLMLVCSMVMCFFISVRLSSIFLVAILILAAALLFIMQRTTRIFNEVFRRYDDLNASVQENVSAIRVVKAFVREEYENSKFRKAAEKLYSLFVKAESHLALNSPVMMLVVYGCILALSWFGAQLIVAGDLTTGNLTSLFSYVMSVLMSLMMLSMVFVMITMSAASGRRIAEVLNEKPDMADPEQPVTEVTDGSIDFHHVNFSYSHGSGEKALQDIDLHIQSGETIGIIGGTGCGKSSLVSLVSRLYDVDSGRVCVGGKDVRAYDMEALRNQVSVVLQKNVLFSGTILDNLRWGKEDATEEECAEACRLACADEFVTCFPDGYHTWIEQGRQQCLRRTETRDLVCTGTVKETENSDSGRLHQRRGHRHRRQNPGSIRQKNPRHHQTDRWRSAFPACRTPIGSWCWTTAGSAVSTATKICCKTMPFTAKFMTHRPRAAATLIIPAPERKEDACQ